MALNSIHKTQIHASKLHVTRASSYEADLDEDTVCRLRRFQRLATINCFTAVNGVAYLMTSCTAAFLGSQLTTLEKQFGFTSRQTGLIMAASNIGYMACVLFVSHMGSSAHIPRALCIGGCCFGVSGIIASLPYFLFSEQLNNEVKDKLSVQREGDAASFMDTAIQGELCTASKKFVGVQCESLGSEKSWSTSGSPQEHIAFISLAIIVTGMIIQGFGKGPRLSFAVTYVDNNTKKTNTGYYSGIMITCSVMGPVLAFLAGGVFSQIYVTLEPTNLDPKHPKWVGAWWLGYLTLGLVTVAVSLPLQLFPRRLPAHHTSKITITPKVVGDTLPLLESATRKQNSHMTPDKNLPFKIKQDTLRPKYHAFMNFVKEFVACQIRLWKNPIFVLMNLCSACIIFAVSANGYTAKYLEHMFDMPAHVANYSMAARSFVATGLGTFLGGYLTRRMSMSALTALRFNVVVLLVGCLASCAGFFIYCNQPNLRLDTSRSAMCSAKCQCSENSFFPVCGQDGLSYYSPCQAGCTNVSNKDHVYWYSGCSCIEGGVASAGMCPYGCSSIYGYILFSALTAFCQTITIMPKIIVFIRCVNDRDKTASMGLQSFTNSLLGYLSGGLAFGSLIDGVCSVWGVTCGVKGHCLKYDNDLFRVRLHSYVTVSMGLAFITALVGYVYARRTDCLSEVVTEKQS